MGASDVVPGVSGGTIAFITGIYEELINSIKSLDAEALKLVLKFRIKDFWAKINGYFLLAVFSGILISIFSLAHLIEYLLKNKPVYIWSFFFGLIVASVIYILKDIKKWNFSIAVSLVVGIILAYWITTITPTETSTELWFVFLSGAIAICAMILPGISGSFILVLLGKYQYILSAVTEFKISVIAVFAAGAVVGIISFSNLLSWLLKKFRFQTIALLAGFMGGSLNKIWPWKETLKSFTDRHGELQPLIQRNILPPDTGLTGDFYPAILLALAGLLIIFFISKLAGASKD
ncbi:MAG: DUF368 domain-containing protein [Bacteroidales bacterium]|nr:DUF368 domain-containing protein [Bacteroidales bacterium]MCF8389506.1 DUF368 domain-containing protein [Bacteroidales bacterium]